MPISIYKPIGQTPLETIQNFKKSNPKYENSKIGYAGRLDPMAHGVLVLLVDPETKNREKYQNLDKVLLGISTDSYDLLGIIRKLKVKNENLKFDKQQLESKIQDYLKTITCNYTQTYPPFSSKTVDGKPLHQWMREGKINEIELPKKIVKIYNATLKSTKTIESSDLQKIIHERVTLINGDFRQDEILAIWDKYFQKHIDNEFFIATIEISCSSGTYMRSIANDLGEKLGYGALAFEILRKSVGKYNLKDSIYL